MNENYFPATGKADEKRLAINNKIYNSTAFSFMLEHGLDKGMQILEIGCGFGYMAILACQKCGTYWQSNCP